MNESNRIELKRELNDGLEKEIVAFLNSREGGILYLGVDDNGRAIGVPQPDEVQLKVKDRLKNNILPSCMGLFDIVQEVKEGYSDFNDIHKLTVTPAALCRFIKKIRAENMIKIEPEQLLKEQTRRIDSQKKEEEIVNISKKEYQTGELPEIDISKFK